MVRSRKMNNNARNSRKSNNSRNSRNSVKRVSMRRVGDASANKASFAAKLGAFICQSQPLKDVVGDVNGFFERANGKAVNQRTFGVLPFLHINISRDQFKKVMDSSGGNLVSSVEKICNSKNLNKTLKDVDFNCRKQSVKGVNDGLIAALMDSIEKDWNSNNNGKRVINKIQAVQLKQVALKKIPAASVAWCRC
jgi:hypothetical protein